MPRTRPRLMSVISRGPVTAAGAAEVTPPSDVTNLLRWYKADGTLYSDAGVTPVVDGGNVGRMTDYSGNNDPANQTTAGNKPVYRASRSDFGGKPTVQFSTDDYLASASLTLSSMTYIAVFKASNAGMVASRQNGATNTNNEYIYTNVDSSFQIKRSSTTTGRNIASNWGTDGTVRTVVARYTNNSTTIAVSLNGVNQSLTNSAPHTGQANGALSAPLYIGARDTGSPADFLNGEIAEILLFDTYLTDVRAAEWVAYLKLKYGHYV